jgi:hexosaminidase
MNSSRNLISKSIDKHYWHAVIFAVFLFEILISSCGFSQINKNSPGVNNNLGLNLLPVPQKASFSGRVFSLSDDWFLEIGNNLSVDGPVVQSLISGLREHGKIKINYNSQKNNNKHKLIRLIIRARSVPVPAVNDSTGDGYMDQAYRLKLDSSEISICANESSGLFYGIQTLLQLITTENGKVKLPEGEIYDWPDMKLRIIYWDCAHHLERLETFKRIIRQAAYFKINAIALKLEGHFQFESAKPIVEPYAFTPAEYQELTDYAKDHFIELIPYLDAPAHVSFILKHPEYDSLRAMPNSNYELCITKSGTYKLLSGMFDDLTDANKGGKYVLLSTDEAYYVGKTENEKGAAAALGGNGKLLADFITRISNKLHEKGRTVIFWGEYPLTASDINALPSHLVNGEYNKDWAPDFKQHGIRQLIYTSTQGEEPLFPNYFPLKLNDTMARTDNAPGLQEIAKGRVESLLKEIYPVVTEGKSNILGVIVAAWGDAGLNPETFWLGYATGIAAAWNNTPKTAQELTDRFFISFYGSKIYKMNRVYQLSSNQAEVWNNSWDLEPSNLRSPIIGNSRGIYDIPRKAMDQTLPVLPIPSARDLSLDKDWSAENLERIQSAERYLKENDELADLLKINIRNVDCQQYNLEVIQSIAMLCRQNLNMLIDLQHIDELLKLSSNIASKDPVAAISFIDQALDRVTVIRNDRNEVLKSLITLWYQDWYPIVNEANGRKYLLQVDDVKDHLPSRTADMSYLIYREIHYPLGDWAKKVIQVRNSYAKEHHLSLRMDIPDWQY